MKCFHCGRDFDPTKQSHFGDFDCSYHPQNPRSIGNTGPRGDYAELWHFPCCGKAVVGEISEEGADITPARTPGCMNGFHSGDRPRIFLSYARTDSRFAAFLEHELVRRGYAIWRDVGNILPGDDWQHRIDAALRESSHLVLLLSPRSVGRPQVNRELGLASKEGVPVIPILIEDCEPPRNLGVLHRIGWRKDQDFAYSNNFAVLDEALEAPQRSHLLDRLRKEAPRQ